MDPLSITVGCVSLVSTIAKTSIAITGFMKDFRSARHDLDTVSRELASLEGIVQLLQDDCDEKNDSSVPETLRQQILNIIGNCSDVLLDLNEVIQKHTTTKMGKAALWVASGKKDVEKYRSTLEAHRGALNLALDLVAV
jgi:Fungal N-terminal domain of STAND proteins